jgi:hypothetical protein
MARAMRYHLPPASRGSSAMFLFLTHYTSIWDLIAVESKEGFEIAIIQYWTTYRYVHTPTGMES